jgi:hypothetical protein
MVELKDYSGDFDPDFSYEKLSKETLLKLLRECSNYIRKIDGHWYLTVMKDSGNEKAYDYDCRVWERMERFEVNMVSEALNIHGDDPLTVAKAVQASPWAWVYDCNVEVKSNDHVIVTYNKCPTLDSLEREGAGREGLICHELSHRLLEIKAHHFNPNIVVKPLKLPPRSGPDDICCRWELKLERAR